MRNRNANALALSTLLLALSILVPAGPPAARAADGGVRSPVDSVGYATAARQMETIVAAAEEYLAGRREKEPDLPAGPMIGGICPHDDYIYAAPAYVNLLRNLEAPLVVLVGVSHAARREGVSGKIVFDTFRAWKGPYGEVPVSSMREDIISAMPRGLVLESEKLHAAEHSLEGLIPFIQYPWPGAAAEGRGGGRKVEILPVLVTMFPGGSSRAAAWAFTEALRGQMEKRGLRLGRDVAVVISADCVHYGDEGWGGRNYAPFGTDREGYRKAVAQDVDIATSTLAGRIDGRKIDAFRERVDSGEFEKPYKIPWCGVYSIPFGLSVIWGLCALDGREAPLGVMLDYSTSLDPGRIDAGRSGLGATNIATLRHWVGYTAVGYW
ncbi:MAG: AmmeMemoRadiSam system protein B [Candidatus Krumholzibacteria bacterium]|nr:AmmeMemoRadiSam system protein B [Candidatus Krumholzibacteria bacterium]